MIERAVLLPWVLVRVSWIVARTLVRQTLMKRRELSRQASSRQEARRVGLRALRFVRRASDQVFLALQGVRRCLEGLEREGVDAAVVYGATETAELFRVLASLYGVSVTAVFDEYARGPFLGREIRSPVELVGTNEIIVIASSVTFERRRRMLEALRIPNARIRHV